MSAETTTTSNAGYSLLSFLRPVEIQEEKSEPRRAHWALSEREQYGFSVAVEHYYADLLWRKAKATRYPPIKGGDLACVASAYSCNTQMHALCTATGLILIFNLSRLLHARQGLKGGCPVQTQALGGLGSRPQCVMKWCCQHPQFLVCVSRSKSQVHMVDTAAGKEYTLHATNDTKVGCQGMIDVSPCKQGPYALAAASRSFISLWDGRISKRPVTTLHAAPQYVLTSLQTSTDGTLAIATVEDRQVLVWDVRRAAGSMTAPTLGGRGLYTHALLHCADMRSALALKPHASRTAPLCPSDELEVIGQYRPGPAVPSRLLESPLVGSLMNPEEPRMMLLLQADRTATVVDMLTWSVLASISFRSAALWPEATCSPAATWCAGGRQVALAGQRLHGQETGELGPPSSFVFFWAPFDKGRGRRADGAICGVQQSFAGLPPLRLDEDAREGLVFGAASDGSIVQVGA